MLKIITPLDRLQNAVVPIYAPDKKRRPEVVGSGVLLVIGEDVLLLTAAHVIDLNDEGDRATFYVPRGLELDALECPAWKNVLPPGKSREHDVLDIGFMAISDEATKLLGHVPLALAAIDSRHRPGGANYYQFCGYPRTMNRPRVPFRSVRPSPLAFTARSVPHRRYEQIGLSPGAQILLGVDLDRVNDMNRTAGPMPDPHGISGGGVFRLTQNRAAGSLIGIALELRRDAKVLIGGGIAGWLQVIATACPHLGAEIQRFSNSQA